MAILGQFGCYPAPAINDCAMTDSYLRPLGYSAVSYHLKAVKWYWSWVTVQC